MCQNIVSSIVVANVELFDTERILSYCFQDENVPPRFEFLDKTLISRASEISFELVVVVRLHRDFTLK